MRSTEPEEAIRSATFRAVKNTLGWLWGPVALTLVALFNVSDHALLSTADTIYLGFSKYAVASLGIPLLAGVVAVWRTKHWPWLLAAGAVAVLITTIGSVGHFASSRPGVMTIISSIGAAGSVLIVIGALAAARDAALVVGAQVLATLFRGLHWLDNLTLRPPALELALAVVAVVGGGLAVYGVRMGRTPQSEPMSRRAAVVGTAAAFLPIVPVGVVVLLTLPRTVTVVAAGVVLLLCVAGLTLALGRGTLLRTAMAGFVLLAVAAPANIGMYFSAGQLTTYGSAAVIGLGTGILAAHLGRSTVVAAAACAVLAVLMLTAVTVTGHYEDVTQGGLGSLLVGLAVAAVTSAAATAAPANPRAMPVVAGPLLLGFGLGFRAVVQLYLAYDEIPHELPETEYLPLWAALLGVAAVVLTTIALLDRKRASSPAAGTPLG